MSKIKELFKFIEEISAFMNKLSQFLRKVTYKYPFFQALYLLLFYGYTYMLVYYETNSQTINCLTSKIIFRLHRRMLAKQLHNGLRKVSKSFGKTADSLTKLATASELAVAEMDQFATVYQNIQKEIINPNAVLAIDFDGTLCEHKFPNIGEPNWELIHYIQWRQKHGAKTILWTCRTGGKLNEAVKWCEERGLYFDTVNENIVDVVNAYGSECRKVYADEYYDDRAVHIFKLPYININK